MIERRYRKRTRLGARFVVLLVVIQFFVISMAMIASAQDEDHFDFIVLKDKTTHVGTAVYERELPGGGVWLDGDRVGYAKAYAFLDCNTANKTLNLRVAAYAYTGTVAATIIDKFMDEGTRLWDGTLDPDGFIPARDSDAPRLVSHGVGWPTSMPVITVKLGNKVCEVRDYNQVVTGPNVTFAVITDTKTQVIVGWYVDGKVAAEFYYDIIGGAYRLEVE